MNKKNLMQILETISTTSLTRAVSYGVHEYEHTEGGQYRVCPESFVVEAAYSAVSKLGFRASAEAHQGGIWHLFKRDYEPSEPGYRYRYDLVIWDNKGNKPAALCEFKWAFSPGGYDKDAENVNRARSEFKTEAILCLVAAKPKAKDLSPLMDKYKDKIEERFGIRAEYRTGSKSTTKLFCGRQKRPEESVYTQVMALALK